MKISKQYLKQVIKEEIEREKNRLNEVGDEVVLLTSLFGMGYFFINAVKNTNMISNYFEDRADKKNAAAREKTRQYDNLLSQIQTEKDSIQSISKDTIKNIVITLQQIREKEQELNNLPATFEDYDDGTTEKKSIKKYTNPKAAEAIDNELMRLGDLLDEQMKIALKELRKNQSLYGKITNRIKQFFSRKK